MSLALLAVAAVAILAACSSTTGPGSAPPGTNPGSTLPAATASRAAATATLRPTDAGSAWAVAHATTATGRLPYGLGREVAIVSAGRVIIFGGFASTGSTTAAILAFDPSDDQVSHVGQLAVPVHDAAGVTLGGTFLIFGGGSTVPVSVVQQIDSSGVSHVIGHLPATRADLSAVSIGSSAIVVGGGASGLLDRRVLATEDGIHFRLLGTLQVGVRYAAVAESGGLIYVIGGVGAGGDRTEIQRIDPVTGNVTVIGNMPDSISHASAMIIGGRMLVVGGRHGAQAQDTIWQLDVATGTTHLAGRLPRPISDFATAVIGDIGYLIGGETTAPVASIVSIVVQ